MNRAFLISLAILTISGIVLTLKYGLQPRPVRLMKPSQFETAEDLGRSVYRRMRQNLMQTQVLIWGLPPGHAEAHLSVFKGFRKEAGLDNYRFDLIVMDKVLVPLELEPVALAKVDFQNSADQAWKMVAAAIKNGKKVAIITASVRSSYFVPDNAAHRLANIAKMRLPAISIVPLANSVQGLKDVRPKCASPGQDSLGSGQLGCLLDSKTRNLIRQKKLPTQQYLGVLEQYGHQDFILFVSIGRRSPSTL